MKVIFASLAMAASALAVPAHAAEKAPELGHWMVAISVADMDAETAFYVDKLGFKVELDTTFGPGIPVRWLVSGNERIELLKIKDSQPGPKKPAPPGHAAVQGFSQITLSTTDIEATRAALAAKGLTPALDITEVAPLGVKVMYYTDPEGNAVEIAQKVG
ncbi:VOC family protein [Altererythrobacter fulvus]|uniref:VOC family protein n=1 Tax=Caenibius fulvus TaxID=2126012 RepID=UPI0030184304